MRVLIVDDERPARDKLRRMLVQEQGICAIEEARKTSSRMDINRKIILRRRCRFNIHNGIQFFRSFHIYLF